MMKVYSQITSRSEADGFLDFVGGFHDGIVKEIHIMNSGFVDDNLSMFEPRTIAARVLVQRQYKDPAAVELVFLQVLRISLTGMRDIDSTSATFQREEKTGLPRIIIDFDGDTIESRTVLYRDASSWLGKDGRFGDYLAGDKIAGTARFVGEGFLMCSECTHVWKPVYRWHRLTFDYGIVFWRTQSKRPAPYIMPEFESEAKIDNLGARLCIAGHILKSYEARAVPGGSEVEFLFEDGVHVVFRNVADCTSIIE